MALIRGVRAAVAAGCLLALAGESRAQVLGGTPDPELVRLRAGQNAAIAELRKLHDEALDAVSANQCARLVVRRNRLWDILNNRNDPFWTRHGLADTSATVISPITAEGRPLAERLFRLQCPSAGALYEQLKAELSGGVTRVRLPGVQDGTSVTPGGEFPIISSERRMSGESASGLFEVPMGRFGGSFRPWQWTMPEEPGAYVPFGGRLRIGASYNRFDGSASGSVPVGEDSAYTYLAPNPASGSTGIGPTGTGQDVRIDTEGHSIDVMADLVNRLYLTGQLPERVTPQAPGEAVIQRWFETGFGLRYRHFEVEHRIRQQSLTFADLNSLIGLEVNSNFLAPNFTLGGGFEPAGPSGVFGGLSGFVAPGVLITDASANQASNCGPCGAGSPEFSWSQQHDFSKSSFAVMTGATGHLGYKFSPYFSMQVEAGLTFMSRADSIAVPITPTAQPVGLDHGSSTEYSVNARLTLTIPPPP
jgi:hypothetical protein